MCVAIITATVTVRDPARLDLSATFKADLVTLFPISDFRRIIGRCD